MLTKLPTITPGLAEYKVRLKDTGGIVVAEFDSDAWISLSFTHRVNERGAIRFEFDGNDDRSNLFATDGQLEVWRRNLIVDVDWYLEWEGFSRTTNTLITGRGTRRFVVYGFGYSDLTRRANIAWPPNSSEAIKSAVAETVMKELVSENIGPSALSASGRILSNVMPGVTIEGDGGNGDVWSSSMGDKNLLSVLQDIALFTSSNDPVDFDIVNNGAAQFQFRTYSGQRGTDRTKDNDDGNAPVIFSLKFGNMIEPNFSENRSTAINAVYATSSGNDSTRLVEKAQSLSEQTISPWNRVEKIINNTASTGGSIGDQLEASANAELEKNKFDFRLFFKVMQTFSTYYGKHYTWGDRISAEFDGQNFDKKIVEVRITVSKNAKGEAIDVEFADN